MLLSFPSVFGREWLHGGLAIGEDAFWPEYIYSYKFLVKFVAFLSVGFLQVEDISMQTMQFLAIRFLLVISFLQLLFLLVSSNGGDALQMPNGLFRFGLNLIFKQLVGPFLDL